MESSNNLFSGYSTGSEFWRDTASSYGVDEAVTICGNYLDMNLKREIHNDEKDFCRELFAEMYEATAGKIDASKLVYPYDFDTANKRFEVSYFHESRNLNHDCARKIDGVINDSCYKTNYYNLEIAAIKAILDCGFSRVNQILAFNIQRKESDGRLSTANKRWAKGFTLPDKAFDGTFLQSHLTLVEDFCSYVRKLYTDFDAERYALPGETENGEFVKGYEVIRAIMFDDKQGFAIANNPNAVNPYVCWQFYIRDSKRDYNLGYYVNEEQDVADNYIARVYVHLS